MQAYEQENKNYQQQSVFVPWKLNTTRETIQNNNNKTKKNMNNSNNNNNDNKTNNTECQGTNCQKPLRNSKYLYCQECHAEMAKIEYTRKKNNNSEIPNSFNPTHNEEMKDQKCVNRYFYLFKKTELEKLVLQFESIYLIESVIEGSKLFVILGKK